jgi:hypothetical protein
MSFSPISSSRHSLLDWVNYTPGGGGCSIAFPLQLPSFPNVQELVDESKKPQEKVILKIAANLLAGGLATGGEKPLDGLFPLQNFQTWEWVLQRLLGSDFPIDKDKVRKILLQIQQIVKQCEFQKKLFNQFSEQEFKEMVHSHVQSIQKLTEGESYSFYGGWGNVGGGSGHALMYEVFRNQMGTFDFRLYTATDFQLADNLLVGDKLRLLPVVCWNQIPEDYLFASPEVGDPPVFFQQLFEMDWSISRYDKNAIVDHDDILEAFDYLAPFLQKTTLQDFGAETGQRAGTCLPSSTKTWARYKFDTLEEYKTFSVYFDLVLITALYKELKPHFEDKGVEGDRRRTTMIYAAEAIVGAIDKALSHIPAALAFQAVRQLSEWIGEIQAISHRIKTEKKQEKITVNLAAQEAQSQLKERTKERYWIEQTQYVDNVAPRPSSFPKYLSLTTRGYLPFLNEIETAYQEKINESSKFSSHQAASLSLHAAIDQLPIPSPQSPWNVLDAATLLQCCQRVRRIGVSYLKNTASLDHPSRRFATLLILYATLHHLTCLIDQKLGRDSKSCLSAYSILFKADELNQLDTLTFHDSHEFERIEQAKAYFIKAHFTKARFKGQMGDKVLFSSEITTEVVKNSIHESPINATLWEELLKSDQELQEAVDKEAAVRFPDYTEQEIEDDFQKQKAALEKWYQAEALHYATHPNKPFLIAKPSGAQKLQNLSLLTKRMLLLEEFDSEKEGNALLATHHQEMNEMRLFSYLMNAAINSPTYFSTSLKRTASRDPNHYTIKCAVNSSVSAEGKFNIEGWNDFIEQIQYLRLHYDHRAFFKIPSTKRDRGHWKRTTAEARALDHKNLPPLLYQSMRTLSEWKLTPHQLLLEWGKDYEHLKDPSLQALFLRLFFRSPVLKGGKVRLGAGQLMDNPDLLANVQTFIEKGLSYFIQVKNKEGAGYDVHDVEGVKFLFELAFLCQKSLVDRKKIDFEAELTQWIDDTTISRTPRALLRLYRLLNYSIKVPLGELNLKQLQQILLDWTTVHLYSDGYRPSQISPLLFRLAEEFMAKVLIHHQESFEKAPDFFCLPLMQTVEYGTQQLKWEVDPDCHHPVYRATSHTKESFKIDFRRGEIFTPTGKATRVILSRSWEDDPNFKRIFWQHPPFEYTMGGKGVVCFFHPRGGSFRIFLARYYKKNLIQRQFGGEWYQYIPHNQIKQETHGLSQAFVKDHVLWGQVKVEKQEIVGAAPRSQEEKKAGSQFSQIFVKRMDGGEVVRLQVDLNKSIEDQIDYFREKLVNSESELDLNKPNGFIVFAGQAMNMKIPLRDLNFQQGSTVFFITSPSPRPESFDLNPTSSAVAASGPPPVNLHSFKGIITSLETGLPVWGVDAKEGHVFEVSEEGDFVKEVRQDRSTYYLKSSASDGLTHFEERDYILTVLDQNDSTERLDFPRYRSLDGNPLSFIRQKGQLVWKDNQQYRLETTPQGFFHSYHKYLYLTPSNVKDPEILLIPYISFPDQKEGARPKEEWGSIPYFECHIQADRIIAQSLEGRFHLAYLYFQDKKYALAIEQMTQIDPIETVSALGFMILERIYKTTPPIDHPDAAMVPLQAALQLIKERDRQSDEPVDTYFGQTREDLQALNNLIVLAHQSLQSINHITEGCLLPDPAKYFLFSKLIKEAQSKKKAFEEQKIKYLASLIEHLEYRLANSSQSRILSKQDRRLPKDRTGGSLKTVDFFLPYPPYKPDELSQTRYRADCRYHTLWLSSGTVPFIINRWPIQEGGDPKENGKLLEKVLKIAKSGTSKNQLALLWKLRNWRLHWKGNNLSLPFLDLMIAIVLTPSKFPDWISDDASPEEKVEFLRKIDQAQTAGLDFQSTIAHHLGQHEKSSLPSSQKRSLAPPSVSWFHQKEPLLHDFGTNKEPLLQEVKGPYDQRRLDKLKKWRTDFFDTKTTQDVIPTMDFSLKENLLSQQDEAYKESIQKDLNVLAADFEEGRKQLLSQQEITFKDPNKLVSELQKEKNTTLTALDQKEKEAQEILNHLISIPFKDFLHRVAQNVIGVKKSISLDKAREALLTFDKRAFKVLNPNLTDAQIIEIAQLLIAIEDLKSWKAQLERMEELVTKGKDIANQDDPTKKDCCRRLLQELEGDYHFKTLPAEEQVIYRIFCGETGLIPFEKQVELIAKILKTSEDDPSRLCDIVIQLIMGGGKTSVIATIVLQFLARRNGNIALFIVPTALFNIISSNLTESLKKSFNQKLEPIQVKRDDLTLYRLEKIEKLLQTAQESSLVITMPPSTIQIFELEFLSQSRKLKAHILEYQNCRSELVTTHDKHRILLLNAQTTKLTALIEERIKKLCKLAHILDIKTQHAHALIDEVHIILDALLEVNFPDGMKMPILAERNELYYTIFSHCMRDDLKIETLQGKPLIRQALNLDLNVQNRLALLEEGEKMQEKQAFYERYQHAISLLANELIDSFAPFQTLPQELKPSFHRFLTNKIPHFVQEFADQKNFQFNEKSLADKDRDWKKFGTCQELKNDVHFLSLLHDRSKSQNAREKQFTALASLARGLLTTILPLTLWKNANRHYGAVPGDPHGKICPYQGVRNPILDREFGFVWEELAYYYQWACMAAPEEAVIGQLAQLATEAAHYYMKKNGELFNATVEYQQFKKFTGVSLQDFQDPHSPLCKEALQKAIAFLEKNPKNRLILQKELAAYQVKMQSFHLSANGSSLCRRQRWRGAMTGTPSDVEGYRQSLADNVVLDTGTEGKVLATLVKKVTKERFHKVTLTANIEELLAQVFEKSLTPQLIYGWMDSGGLLQFYPDQMKLVPQILLALEKWKKKGKVNPDIDTVLFFHQNTFYMWKMGAQSPEKVGATSQKALMAKGLVPRQYFTLYDEDHVTGTDILQVPDAVNLMTIEPKTRLPTIPQSSMRLRQLLFSQSVELIVDKAAVADIYRKGETIEDLILNSAKNQSIKKMNDMPRYCKMQIDDSFRFPAVENLVQSFLKPWNEGHFLDLMDKGEPYFVKTMKDDLYAQFGRIPKRELSKSAMKNRLTNLEQRYPFPSPALNQEIAALKKHIDKIPLPPDMEIQCEGLGMENEVEAAVEVDVNVEQEQQKAVEVDEDIELELLGYENLEPSEYLPDHPISAEDFRTLVKELSSKQRPPFISISDQLKKFKYGFQNKTKHYDKIFSEPIYGTESYFNSCKFTLPVFHRLQRPPTQILVVQGEGGIRWLLVSEHEGHSIKKHLKSYPDKENIWLIQTNGSALAPTTPFPLEQEHDDILRGLLEINAFNGNADWLGYYEHYLSPWLVGDFELKLDFLKLRTARHPHQRQILAYLPSILKMNQNQTIDQTSNRMIFSERAVKELQFSGEVYTPSSVKETKLLVSMRKIERLSDTDVRHLGIDPTKKDLDTQDALKELRARCRGADDIEFPSHVANHSKTQIKYLRNTQVQYLLGEQLQWIHLDQVPHLRFAHQIKQDNTYFLTQDQLVRLTPEQAELIPYVNPAYYSNLTLPAHIGEVPPQYVDKIQAKYGYCLTPKQIDEGITTGKLLEKYGDSFLSTQWAHVDPKLALEMPPAEVTDHQFQNLTAQQVLQLTGEHARGIPQIKPAHYPHITSLELVQKIPPAHLDKINPSYQGRLTKAQIQEGITTTQLLHRFSSSFTDTDWQHVSGELIRDIPVDKITQQKIQQIKDPLLIQSLHKIAPTEELRLSWIGWLAESQVRFLVDEQLRYLRNPRRISSLSFWKSMTFLSPEQLQYLTYWQRATHVMILYCFGALSKIALRTGLARLFQITLQCSQYSTRLSQLHRFFRGLS